MCSRVPLSHVNSCYMCHGCDQHWVCPLVDPCGTEGECGTSGGSMYSRSSSRSGGGKERPEGQREPSGTLWYLSFALSSSALSHSSGWVRAHRRAISAP